MIPLPTRREHESYDLGPFTVRVGRMPPDGVEAMVERVAKALDPFAFSEVGDPDDCSDLDREEARQEARNVLAVLGLSWPPVIEVFFDRRAKAGTEINAFLHDAGVLISKVLQGKDV